MDFETYYDSKVSVKRMIAEQYGRETDVYLLSVCDGTSSWVGHPSKFNWATFDGATLVAHNSYFELNIWRTLAEKGLAPPPNFAKLHCTANLTSYLCNQRSLANACEVLYGEKVSKEAREEAKGKRWPQDFSEDERKAMLEYAKGDAVKCWRLFNDFGHLWPEVEQELSRITIEQGTRGVQIDVPLLHEYIVLAHDMKANTEKLIPWIQDADDDSWEDFDTKPTSTKCIAEQCRRTGIPCPPVKSENEEGYEEWEDTHGSRYPWIFALSQWRSINKLYRSFMTMNERLRPDGTMPFGLKYFGAHTGRWSGESKVNFQNQRKRPVLVTERQLMETGPAKLAAAYDQHDQSGTWPEWVRSTLDFRALIIPRPGKKMIVADLAQIEPRVLAWLAGDSATLDYLRSGMSIYEAHARATMGWTGGGLKHENPGLYQLAKAQCIAEGTLVLTDSGYAAIENVRPYDLVWDGIEWVAHQGLVCKGVQTVVRVGEEYYTEDHEIYGKTGTRRAGLLSEGELASNLERRTCPGSGWADVWALANRVFRDVSQEWSAACYRRLHGLSEELRRAIFKLSQRVFHAVRRVWHKGGESD